MSDIENNNTFMFYSAEDGTTNISVLIKNGTTWSSINGMAEIFGIDKSGISRHLKKYLNLVSLKKYQLLQKLQQLEVMKLTNTIP